MLHSLSEVVLRMLNFPTRCYNISKSRGILREMLSNVRTIDRFVYELSDVQLQGIQITAAQSREEYRDLLHELHNRHIHTACEIGVDKGGSLLGICRVIESDANIVAVDKKLPWFKELFYAFRGPGQRLALLEMDSHDPYAYERIRFEMRGEPMDFVHLDGDHTLSGQQADFALAIRISGPNAIIAVHDIRGFPKLYDWYGEYKTKEFWNIIKKRYVTKEISMDVAGGGTGIVYLGGK